MIWVISKLAQRHRQTKEVHDDHRKAQGDVSIRAWFYIQPIDVKHLRQVPFWRRTDIRKFRFYTFTAESTNNYRFVVTKGDQVFYTGIYPSHEPIGMEFGDTCEECEDIEIDILVVRKQVAVARHRTRIRVWRQ